MGFYVTINVIHYLMFNYTFYQVVFNTILYFMFMHFFLQIIDFNVYIDMFSNYIYFNVYVHIYLFMRNLIVRAYFVLVLMEIVPWLKADTLLKLKL